ncbi:hypothetical protein HYFRA_00002182 [Hymenoscyphus fraxineus]|uniref:Uncharacterized protein n=1 Tax=Hymenoscyphus fraxineus TaxID=746836 RepID=A0A9N9KL93_9HELO|nr:hypothetical protein HYFRA_00002182 [Hymenoscyphus fraxineus]
MQFTSFFLLVLGATTVLPAPVDIELSQVASPLSSLNKREPTTPLSEFLPTVHARGKGKGKNGDNDNDGIPNSLDNDSDNDGVVNDLDNDSDNDGVPNALDNDSDNDGVPDGIDTDSDDDDVGNINGNCSNDRALCNPNQGACSRSGNDATNCCCV